MNKWMLVVTFIITFLISTDGFTKSSYIPQDVINERISSPRTANSIQLVKVVKRKKNKDQEPEGGIVLLDNPYGEKSSEWARIDLYSKPHFKGEHWVIDVYGARYTIKDDKKRSYKKFKDNFFKSARISISTDGAIYFYDNYKFNRQQDSSFGWASLPSHATRLEIPNFDSSSDEQKTLAKAYYRFNQLEEGISLSGRLSSIIIKFSKMH